MAVLHYSKDMCGTKAKTINSTDDKALVTCKRCLNKMKSSNMGKVRVEKIKENTTITFKRLQFKFKTHENNDMFMFTAPDGYIYTSAALSGTNIKRNMVEKDRLYFKDLFVALKNDGELTSENIYKHFNG